MVMTKTLSVSVFVVRYCTLLFFPSLSLLLKHVLLCCFFQKDFKI